jgi:hypothetical protein
MTEDTVLFFHSPLSAWAFAALRAGMGADRGGEVEVFLPEEATELPLWAAPAFYAFPPEGCERIWTPGRDEGEAVLFPPPDLPPSPERLAEIFRAARGEALPAFHLSAAAAALGAWVRAEGEAGRALAALALREEVARRPALSAVLAALGRPLQPMRLPAPVGVPRSCLVLFLAAGGAREAAWAEAELSRRVPEIPPEDLRWALEQALGSGLGEILLRVLGRLGRRVPPEALLPPGREIPGDLGDDPGLGMALAVAGRLDPELLPVPWREKARALRGEAVDLREVAAQALWERERGEKDPRFEGPLFFLGRLAGGRGAEALWGPDEEAVSSSLWKAVVREPPPPGAHPGLVGVHRALRGDPEGIRQALRAPWPDPDAEGAAMFLLMEEAPLMALPEEVARALLERAAAGGAKAVDPAGAYAGELLARLDPRWAAELLIRRPDRAAWWLRRVPPEAARAAVEAAWPALPDSWRGHVALGLPDPDPALIARAWEDLAEDPDGSVRAVAAWAGRAFLPGWAERVRAWLAPRWSPGEPDPMGGALWAAIALREGAHAVAAAFAAGWEVPADLLEVPGWVDLLEASPAVLRRLREIGRLPEEARTLLRPLARAAAAIAADPAFREEAGRVLEEALPALRGAGGPKEAPEAFAAMQAAAAAGRADLFRQLAEGPAARLAATDLRAWRIQEEVWALPPDLPPADRAALAEAARRLALPGLLLALGEAEEAARAARWMPARLGTMPPDWAAFPGAWEAMAAVLADALASPAGAIRRDALWALARADGLGVRISPRAAAALRPALWGWLIWEDNPELLMDAVQFGVVDYFKNQK